MNFSILLFFSFSHINAFSKNIFFIFYIFNLILTIFIFRFSLTTSIDVDQANSPSTNPTYGATDLSVLNSQPLKQLPPQHYQSPLSLHPIHPQLQNHQLLQLQQTPQQAHQHHQPPYYQQLNQQCYNKKFIESSKLRLIEMSAFLKADSTPRTKTYNPSNPSTPLTTSAPHQPTILHKLIYIDNDAISDQDFEVWV